MEWTIEIIFRVPSHKPAPISIEIEWKLSFSILQYRYLSLIPSICSFFCHSILWMGCVCRVAKYGNDFRMHLHLKSMTFWSKLGHKLLFAPFTACARFSAIFEVWQVIVRPFSWAVTLLWTRKLILLLAKWNNALVNIVGVNCIQIGHVHKIHFSASHECAQPLSCSD